jgi:hypothetical protein
MLFAAEDGALFQQHHRHQRHHQHQRQRQSDSAETLTPLPFASRAPSPSQSPSLSPPPPPSFHFLVHRFAAGNGSTVGAAVGGHAYSADGLTWTYSIHAAYNTTLVFSGDGGGLGLAGTHRRKSSATTLYRRERPKPIFGRGGEWIGMFNGAWSVRASVSLRSIALGCLLYAHSHPYISSSMALSLCFYRSIALHDGQQPRR